MRLPDFLIGGAPRSGTTWLHHLLDRHPAIYMAKPLKPEPKFFLIDDVYARGLEYYARTWFAGAGAGVMAGEKSTNYLESGAAAERIARDLPDVRVIFVLRDPVSRAWSNYLWTKMNGLEQEDFMTALRLEGERERTLPDRLRFARPYAYFSRGLYADLLASYFSRFPRERILVLNFDDVAARPAEIAARAHAFLGVDVRPADARDLGMINASEGEPHGIPDNARRYLEEQYAEPNRRLAALLGPEFEWKTAA